MIGVDGKKILPVYGDMRPVEVRRNNVRIAGWLTETKSGEAVDFENTYNDKAEVLVHGNSMQDGEPSPENPVPVLSAGECNLLISDRTGVRQSIALPPLRKIGDVADSYNPKTGEHVQRIGVKVLDGTESFNPGSSQPGQFYKLYLNFVSIYNSQPKSMCFCSHFREQTYADWTDANQAGVYIGSRDIHLTINKDLVNSSSAFRQWLAAQHAAGTPVKVYYQLVEPIITHIDPVTVPTYPWYTRIEQDGAVKGVIEATCKVME